MDISAISRTRFYLATWPYTQQILESMRIDEMVSPRLESHQPDLKAQIRLYYGEDIAMGPGKAELLNAIAHQGSISAAARQMGMSYRRAWLLVDTMNRCFQTPVVISSAGGKHGGGAQLSPLGQQVLAMYQDMVADIEHELSSHAERWCALLNPTPPAATTAPAPLAN